MSIESRTGAIKREAERLGFDLCRVTAVGDAPHADFYDAWIGAGRHGDMRYLATTTALRRNPQRVAGEKRAPVRSIIVLAVRYHAQTLPLDVQQDPSRGQIASYAWSDDYHEVMRKRLHALDAFVRAQSGRTTLAKALVDSGPILERDWAQRAGIGFTGKNTCTIHPRYGSWLLLATLLVPEELTSDPVPRSLHSEPEPSAVLSGLAPRGAYGAWQIPVEGTDVAGTCGRCTRCLDGCPTGAFVGPFHLDPLRCISYWTIETQAPIPRQLRAHFGNHIFGCDICQDVCPWNHRPGAAGAGPQPSDPSFVERAAPPLLEGFAAESPYWLDEQHFRVRFRASPVLRATRAGMLRNVCVALGNWASPTALPALERALQDVDAAPRGHAAWALGQLAARHESEPIQSLLLGQAAQEMDAWVREEIRLAMERCLAARLSG